MIDFGRRPNRPSSALRPTFLESLSHDVNDGLVLAQRVDLAQPVGPQFVPVRQEDLKQTALPLSALNHARSFAEGSRAAVWYLRSIVASESRTFSHGQSSLATTMQSRSHSFPQPKSSLARLRHRGDT